MVLAAENKRMSSYNPFVPPFVFLHSLNLKLARFLHLYEKFSLAFSTWYPSNRKAFFLFEKVFLYPTNQCGRFFAPFNKFLKKLCFEEHEKRQPLRIEQLPLMKYEIEILSVYGGIFRAHFLEVFVYRAYRSGKQIGRASCRERV